MNYEIPDKTLACLGGINAFQYDYVKYAEAFFSEEVDDEVRDQKVEKFLRESKDYYKQLEHRIKDNKIDNTFPYPYISNVICNYVIKILQVNPIK